MRAAHLRPSVIPLLASALFVLAMPVPQVRAEMCAAPPAGPVTAIGFSFGAAGNTPEGLTTSEWNKMQAAVERDQYRLSLRGEDFHARNHAQQLEVTFSPEGFEVSPRKAERQWRWGLHLSGYGYGDRVEAVSPAELVVRAGRHARQLRRR